MEGVGQPWGGSSGGVCVGNDGGGDVGAGAKQQGGVAAAGWGETVVAPAAVGEGSIIG